ncbi:MAG: hypothetical protein KDC83_15470, partial [Flavobacteriales bacterium]|nr:hypothetical protein [Flavobacteriales bacterium]
EAAAGVLWDVGQARALRKFENPTPEQIAATEASFKQPILDQYAHESDPYFATARLWDDGIIDPAQTRMALGLAFSTTLNAGLGNGRFGTFRM